MKKRKPTKYRAIRTQVDGIWFHSKGEAARYVRLAQEQDLKLISKLELQKPYVCIVAGAKICTYYADFYYWDETKREWITEDFKGVRTAIYKLKKKLVEAIFYIEILETFKP